MANLVNLFDRIVKLTPFLPQEFGAMAKTIASPGVLADMIASIINATLEEKQQILETLDIKERLKEVTRLVNHQVEILELGSKIQSQVKNDMDKSQREFYLRQQMKAIKENWEKRMSPGLKSMNTGRRLPKRICRTKPGRKPNGNWTGSPGCIPPQPNIPSPHPIWTGSRPSPGMKARKTTWISRKPEGSWMRIITAWKKPKSALLNTWRCAN